MLDAPRQDWQLFEAMSRDADAVWLRGLSTDERFALYADLFNTVLAGRSAMPASERLDQMNWREKQEIRLRLASAFAQWDEWRRERAAADHVD